MNQNNQASISEAILNRKGARKASEISDYVVELLNSGQIESVNLTEWLAIDHLKLLRHVLIELELQHLTEKWLLSLESVSGQATMKTIPVIAAQWLEYMSQMNEAESVKLFQQLATHQSDSVRCWAAYIVGIDKSDLEQKLLNIRSFANDSHFGVREIAWMAVRESVSDQLEASIQLLHDWIVDPEINIRRFAIELTRPRGVWAKHITKLKDNPEIAISLLEPVKADASKYVQDSVSNWLNDAAKSKPEWVVQVCQEWLAVSDTPETKRIAKRAQRSIN